MSVCGNCPYQTEKEIYELEEEDGEVEASDCQEYGCTFEDAAYRAQWAYEQLEKRYDRLKWQNEELLKELERINGREDED